MRLLLILSLLCLISCNQSTPVLSGEEIIQKSIKKHDPKNQWSSAEFTFRIQEPRLQNPERFSLVYLNNKTGAFKLMRNRDDKIASYGINAEGNINILLDNKAVEDSLLIKKYLLQPERVDRYKNSYQTMLGLPMTLNDEFISDIGAISQTRFDREPTYKIPVTLKRNVFSDQWILYISKEDFMLKAIDILHPGEPDRGERLYFEKSIQVQDMLLNRMKHWYDNKEVYLGSDVIVNEL